MNAVALIGIDLGKHSFHLHAQDEKGRMVFRKKVLRSQILTVLGNVPACDIVMEACAGAHWMARQLDGLGYDAKLISPQFVKPFVPGNKNDFADAQAICEAASSGGPGLLDRILPGLSGFLRFRLPAGWAANQSTRYRGFCRQARNVGAVHCKT